MIRNTFSILQGIGEKLERKLWQSGILTWDAFIDTPQIHFISPVKKAVFDQSLSDALHAIEMSDYRYLARAIKRRDHWRLFDIFKEEAACLDIETNGFMPGIGGYVTMVGIYDGFDYICLVRHQNLSSETLVEELSRYRYLITFYGAGFDVPFLMRTMPGATFDMPHFDVCYGTRKLGFRGGLKKLESAWGIVRDETVQGMDGYDAVKLWEQVEKGSNEALEILKLYNKEDTVNLYKIAINTYEQLRLQTGIDDYL